MDKQQSRDWETSLDAAEQHPLTEHLPVDAPAGTLFQELGPDDVLRRWQRVTIVAGNSGSRWAYWAAWIDKSTGRYGVGPHPEFQAIADGIFNGDAGHFIGMLGVPFTRLPSRSLAWVLVSPRLTPPPLVKIPETPPAVRYEKSKETFDVETQETKKLP